MNRRLPEVSLAQSPKNGCIIRTRPHWNQTVIHAHYLLTAHVSFVSEPLMARYSSRGYTMPHLTVIIFTLVLFLPRISFSETKETEALGRITEQYGRCADVAFGNFETNKKAQDAFGHLFKAMVKNISSIIEIEKAQGDERITLFFDIMGKEVFTGYLLRAFADVNETFRKEKKSLMEENNWNWERTHQQLWSKYGCDAIYKGLPH